MLALLTFVGFTALVALITWWRTRSEDLGHSEGYFLGGRSLTWVVIAGSLMMTNISTEQLVGLNGGAYLSGVVVMAWEVVAAIGLIVMALWLLPRYLQRGVTTVPQFLEARFSRGVRSMMALLTVFGMVVMVLPFVLYTGALSLIELYDLAKVTGLPHQTTLMATVVTLAVIGGAYAVAGGLKAVAVSDTINGLGLLLGGTLVTVLAFLEVGSGSLLRAGRILMEKYPDKLNAIGGESAAVPFSSLFTGMLMISVSYWGLNQFIIQRTFGARSLAEGQKGVLFAGLLKVLGVGLLVLPGILAFHLFEGQLPKADMAYPRLVAAVLPSWLTGFFGAVLFGAILSTFNSVIHSLSTIFSVDFYKPVLRRNASDHGVVLAGKLVGIALTVLSILVVPLITHSPDGVFALMKRIGGYLAGSQTAIVLAAMLFSRTRPLAAYLAVPVGAVFYGFFADVRGGLIFTWHGADVRLHWLHLYGLNMLLLFLLILLVRWLWPLREPPPVPESRPPDGLDLRPWRHVRLASAVLAVLVVLVYVLFSPLGVGR